MAFICLVFKGVLIIWDKMFGTFEAERTDDPPVYGLIHQEQEHTFNQLWLQAFLILTYVLSKFLLSLSVSHIEIFAVRQMAHKKMHTGCHCFLQCWTN
jgi:sterol desaturase/sphingolipid hydroxylase (fatty acid hydroxylase superfamily)